MPTHTFAVTWDYRCPFARNAHEHVVTGLQGGADWDVVLRADAAPPNSTDWSNLLIVARRAAE